jgi:hypothetical protein
LDEGQAAAQDEVDPLSISDAAKNMNLTEMPMPSLSAIPDAPYIVQALPVELQLQRDNKLKRGEKKIRFNHWEFTVVDELNNIVHQRTGDGFPPSPLTWDGKKDEKFVLEPNRAYFSYLRLSAHGEPDHTMVGESIRFIAFLKAEGDDTVIQLGERIYKKDEAQFSDESKLILSDLAQRLSHNGAFYLKNTDRQADWHLTVYEPTYREALANSRKALWKTTLEKMLGRKLPDDRFEVRCTDAEDSVVSLVFPRTKPPLTDLALRGEATASMKPIIEPMSTIVKVRETKKMILIK